MIRLSEIRDSHTSRGKTSAKKIRSREVPPKPKGVHRGLGAAPPAQGRGWRALNPPTKGDAGSGVSGCRALLWHRPEHLQLKIKEPTQKAKISKVSCTL